MLSDDSTKLDLKNTQKPDKTQILKKATIKKTANKYDWLISSGDIELGVYHADIINNVTEHELGSYIRNNIGELYDHFLFAASIIVKDDKEKIGKIMRKLFKKYGNDFMDPDTNKELDKIDKLIKKKLKIFSDLEIVSELNYFGSLHEGLYIRISKLNKKIKYLIDNGDYS